MASDGFVRPFAPEELDACEAAYNRGRPRGNSASVAVVNAIPTQTLATARVVAFRSQRYTMRRLSFDDGATLHGLYHALRQVGSDGDGYDVARRRVMYARAVRTHLGVLLRRGGRRFCLRFLPRTWGDAIAAVLPTQFPGLTAGELGVLVSACLTLPDDVPIQHDAADGARSFDVRESYALVADRLPAFIGPDGWPRSWDHFILALTHISKETGKGILRDFSVGAAAQQGGDGAKDLLTRAQQMAGTN